MNKNKFMLSGLAVFVALMMLATTAVARPVEEKTNMETLEDKIENTKNDIKPLVSEGG